MSTGYIYKITSPSNKAYYGKTRKNIYVRMSQHINAYNSHRKTNPTYCSSFFLFDEKGINKCKIELMEELEAATDDELSRREHLYINNFKCVNIYGKDKKFQPEGKMIQKLSNKIKNGLIDAIISGDEMRESKFRDALLLVTNEDDVYELKEDDEDEFVEDEDFEKYLEKESGKDNKPLIFSRAKKT